MFRQIDIWVQTAGLGHVTRQIALARTLIQLGLANAAHICFFVDEDAAIQRTLANADMQFFVRATSFEQAAADMETRWQSAPADVFVLDSVDLDGVPAVAALLEHPRVLSLAVIDDPSNRPVNADIIVNPLPTLTNASAPPTCPRQKTVASTYLLGKDYFIIAPEFADWHARPREVSPRVQRAFAFFGGADGNNFTPIFFDAVEQGDGIEWTLLIGSLYPFTHQAIQEIERRKLPITPVLHLADMGQTFSETDLALIAAGNTLIEAAAVGAPTLAFAQNEIQLENANYFVNTCNLPCLGLYGAFGAPAVAAAIRQWSANAAARARLSRALRLQIDGRGAARVAQILAARLAGTSD